MWNKANMEVIGSDQRALRLLNKLLIAAERAQIEGKHIALSKIISEANKLSNKLNDSIERTSNLGIENKRVSGYRLVHGEIVE